MAIITNQIAVRDGPLTTAGIRNTGPVADWETTRFINVHGIEGIETFAQLKPDQIDMVVKAYNNSLPSGMLPLGISKQNGIVGIMWKAMDLT